MFFSRSVIAVVLLGLKSVSAQLGEQQVLYTGNGTTSGCLEACTTLASTLGEGHKLFYQTLNSSLLTYYSLRQRLATPLCLALPHSPEDVSLIMRTVAQHSCTFAAKSGGHAMFPGASSAPGGVTIDLNMLNGLELEEDRKTVRVGAGNLWTNVYAFLDPLGLTAVGGRVGNVGVGGFLLGGGISFVSRKHGWGADNVRNYEVVLANGSISNINYKSHPDLYWALRGGGAGFGIVTRFDLETHPEVTAWGDFTGMVVSDFDSRTRTISTARTPRNIYARARIAIAPYLARLACILGYCVTVDEYIELLWSTLEESKNDAYSQVYGYMTLLSWGNFAGFHTTNARGNEDVPAFRELKKGKKVVSNPRIGGWAGFADEMTTLSAVPGKRISYSTLTFKNPDLKLIKHLYSIYLEEVEPLFSLDKTFASTENNILATLPMMFVTKDEIIHMAKNGGNPLGLKPEDAPLMIFPLSLGWPDAEDDDIIFDTAKRIIFRCTALAKETDQFHPFLYQNYASRFQDVFAGYGEENRKRLREIQRKYDPEDVFQRLQAGYFKV